MERTKTIAEIVAIYLQEIWRKTPRGLTQKDIAIRLNKSEPYISILLSGNLKRLQGLKFNAVCEFIFEVDPAGFTKNMSDLMSLVDKELQKREAIIKDE